MIVMQKGHFMMNLACVAALGESRDSGSSAVDKRPALFLARKLADFL